MTASLAGLIDRVEALLMDSSNAVWDTATITEAVRLAVGEYSTANEAAVTVQDLDGAPVTTLPALHDSVIVLGAAGYAAVARAADRAESFTLGSEPGSLKAWGEARLKEFRAMLGFIFPGYMAALAGPGGGADPAKTAAEAALLAAQAAEVTGREARAQAEAERASAERAAEAARRQALRESPNSPWGTWSSPE